MLYFFGCGIIPKHAEVPEALGSLQYNSAPLLHRQTYVAAFKQNDRTTERGGPSGGTNHIYELSHGDITSVAVLSNVTVEMGS